MCLTFVSESSLPRQWKAPKHNFPHFLFGFFSAISLQMQTAPDKAKRIRLYRAILYFLCLTLQENEILFYADYLVRQTRAHPSIHTPRRASEAWSWKSECNFIPLSQFLRFFLYIFFGFFFWKANITSCCEKRQEQAVDVPRVTVGGKSRRSSFVWRVLGSLGGVKGL